jgi:phosphate transport system ATP-binding protein
MPTCLDIRGLDAFYGGFLALRGVSMAIERHGVTAIIGPSGCGKSTLLRSLNRMHETVPGAGIRGTVRLDGADIYAGTVDPAAVRRSVGMVFQRPNPFLTMSVYENVLAGLRPVRRYPKSVLDEMVEHSLRAAHLWTEVRQKLRTPGGSLSGGQQQRLCIARAIALEPTVLLMDEPCSSLDPIATHGIESLISELKQRYTIVIVTHNMQQAARISDHTAFFTVATAGGPGELVEAGPTAAIFRAAADPQTRRYVAGRFG